MSDKKVNPVLVEIIRNAFNSAAEEMNASMFRSAYSPIIYEMKDCSVGIFDREARLLGQAAGLPIFLGNLETCIKLVTEKIGLGGYHEGDVYIMNDSYLQGTHLSDITIFAPIFYRDELVGFSATRADGGHIGSKDLGPSTDTTHIYQEGVRIPPIRLVEEGVLNQDLMDLLSLNSFRHLARRGDLNAQISACNKGSQRVCELFDKFGKDVIRAAVEEIFRQSEALDRQAVEAIPDGVYTAQGYVDNDGRVDRQILVKVSVRIQGDRIAVDLTGSSGPTEGPVNCGKAQAISACRVAFKELINPEIEVTGGNFRNLEVIVPENSLFDAQEPSPCQWYFTPLGLLIDLIVKALSEVLPRRAAGAHFGDSMIASFVGQNPRDGKAYGFIEATVGGWGGFANGDGQDCLINAVNGDFKNLPVEFVENKFPVRVLAYGIRQDSEGAGKQRGGLGAVRDFLLEEDGSYLYVWMDRTKTPAWGLFGGQEAATPVTIVNPQTPDERRYNKVNYLKLQKNDVVRVYTGGGGGFGDPRERDVERIKNDVDNGYISPERAKKVYGFNL